MSWIDDQKKRLLALATTANRNVRDVFDANTESDQAKRLAAGQPRYYQDQQAQQKAQPPIQRISTPISTQFGTFNAPPKPQVQQRPQDTGVSQFLGRNIQPVVKSVIGTNQQNDKRNFLSKAWDQVNIGDSGRSFRQSTPTNKDNLATQYAKATFGPLAGVQLRGARVVTGAAEGLSGLVDLATPGTGTNRVTQGLNKLGGQIDKTAKTVGGGAAYKIAEVPAEVASFFVPGEALVAGAKFIPGGTKAIKATDKALDTFGSKGGKIGKAITGSLKPTEIGTEAAITGKYIGEDVSKNREITPQRVALDVFTGVGGDSIVRLVNSLRRLNIRNVENLARETDAGKIEEAITRDVPEITPDKAKDISIKLAEADTPEKVTSVLATAKTDLAPPTAPVETPTTAITQPDVVKNLTSNKSPEQVKIAVKALYPNLDDVSLEAVSQRIAKSTSDKEVEQALLEASQRSENVTTAVDGEVAPKVPEQTIEQTLDGQPVGRQSTPEQPAQTQQLDSTAQQTANIVPGATTADNVPGAAPIENAPTDISPEAMAARNQAEAERLKKSKFRQFRDWASRTWDPRTELRKIDKAMEKKLGRKLDPSESAENAARFSESAGSRSAGFIESSSLAPIVKKYGRGTEGERDFVSYLVYQRDLEIRSEGGQPLTSGSTEDLVKNIADLEAKYPGIREDGLSVTQGYVRRLQEMSATGEDAFVSIDDLNKVRTKKDGTEFQWYVPIHRVTAEGVLRPEINARNIGSISRDRVLQARDATGDFEQTFDALGELSDIVHKQQGQARVANRINAATEQGVGGTEFIQTAEQAGRRKQLRQTLQELRDTATSLQKSIGKGKLRVKKAEKAMLGSKKTVVDEAKSKIRSEARTIAQELKDEIAKAKVNLRVQKAKLGVPRLKKSIAESAAVIRARAELSKHTLDADSQAAVSSLSKDDLLKVFTAIADDAPIPANTRGILRKLVKTDQQYNDLVRRIDGTKAQIDDARQKLSDVMANDTSKEKIKNMSDDELVGFLDNVINNDAATPRQKQAMARYLKKNEAFQEVAEDLEWQKLDAEALDDAKGGVRQEISDLGADSTTGLQVIRGLDADGNQFIIETPPELARYLQGIGSGNYKNFIKIGRTAQAPFRQAFTGVVGNPSFQAKQAIWNALLVPFTSPRGFKIYAPSAIKAGFTALNNSSEMQRGLTKYGVSRYGSDLHKLASDNTIDAVAANKYFVSRMKWYNPFTKGGIARNWGNINELGGKIDQMYRTMAAKAEYDYVLKKTGSVEEARIAAVRAHDTVLPDFGNVAQLVKAIDAVIPYTAAGQAGTRTFLRAWKEQPIKNTSILALYASPVVGLTAYNYSHDAGETYYKDMAENGKQYTLDTNAILVLPGAHKDETTGEWNGVIKLPVPPEFRPATKAIRESFTANEGDKKGVPIRAYARAMFDTVTGAALNNPKSPAISTLVGLATGKNTQYGGDIYDPNATKAEKVLQGGKFVLGNLGTIGKAASDATYGKNENGEKVKVNPVDTYKNTFVEMFYGGKGSTSASRYFANKDKTTKEVGLNKRQIDAVNSVISPPNKDLSGEDIKGKSFWDPQLRAIAWLDDMQSNDKDAGKLWEYSKKMNDKLKAEGKPTDPLFDLSGNQLTAVLTAMSKPTGDPERDAIKKLNPWIKDFDKQRGEYFDKVFGEEAGKDYTGTTMPKADKTLQGKIDALTTMPKEAKAQFMKDNPEIADYFASQDAYQRFKRDTMGLLQFDAYPKASPAVQKAMDEYNSLPKGNGPVGKTTGKATSPDRSAWIKSHPNEWAAMTEQWYKQNLYNLQGDAALAVYEGIDIPQESIDKLGTGSTGSGGYSKFGYGNSGGSKKDDTPRTYAAQLLSGLPTDFTKTPNIDVTPSKTKFKVKTPSGKGRSYKRIRLQ